MSLSSELLPGVPLIESPLFARSIDQMGLSEAETAVAMALHERGYAVIDFPDPAIDQRIERIIERLGPLFGVEFSDPEAAKNTQETRIQDAWKTDEDVRAIATNREVLALLAKLYGRRAFPFQTLNFPVGTQQHLHSDAVHFSSVPERFMCGVWVAFEDVRPEAGPLHYVAGSHKWPIISNAMIGRRGWQSRSDSAQGPFEAVWQAMIAADGQESETFLAQRGQALIWAANLLHGGAPQLDPRMTRWSQVTHYYFDNCMYYTPAYSDETLGRLDLRTITNIATGEIQPCSFLGEEVRAQAPRKTLFARVRDSFNQRRRGLPADFDPQAYCVLHPDVALAGIDPGEHYIRHGAAEGRKYRLEAPLA
jgi:hypothetical protein